MSKAYWIEQDIALRRSAKRRAVEIIWGVFALGAVCGALLAAIFWAA